MPTRSGIIDIANQSSELFVSPDRGGGVWLYFAIDGENLPHRTFPFRAGFDPVLLRRYTRRHRSLALFLHVLLMDEITDPDGADAWGRALKRTPFMEPVAMVYVGKIGAGLPLDPDLSFTDAVSMVLSHEIVHTLIAPIGPDFSGGEHVLDPDKDGNFVDALGVTHGVVPDIDDFLFLMRNASLQNIPSPRFSEPTIEELDIERTIRR